MPASIRTLSQLPEVSSNIGSDSLFEVAVPVQLIGMDNAYRYSNRKITSKNLSEKIVSDALFELAQNNGLSGNMNVWDLCATVSAIANSSFTFNGNKTFKTNPFIKESTLSNNLQSSSNNDDKKLVDYGTLKKYAAINSSPTIGPNYGFVTTLSSGSSSMGDLSSRNLNIFKVRKNSSGINEYASAPDFVFDQTAKNVVPNEYVFRIPQSSKESNEWVAPESGIFTCYGWLDEINNAAQSNEKRWVALLGKQNQLSRWTILQVQPFIKNNYVSYVGFTFPVKRGMLLKIATGFSVGSNSDKYFNSTNSITNHVANAFLGGIYTELSSGTGGPALSYDSAEFIDARFTDLSSKLSALSVHEDDCDLDVNNKISTINETIVELSGKIPENDSQVKTLFVDGNKLSASFDDGGMDECSLYYGTDWNAISGLPNYSWNYFGTEAANNGIIYHGNFYALTNMTEEFIDDDPDIVCENNKYYKRVNGANGYFTDDYFWYYVVPKTGFYHVVTQPGIAKDPSPNVGVQCYIRYLSGEAFEPCFKMMNASVSKKTTTYANVITDDAACFDMPLKRGTTLAFAAYSGKIFNTTAKTWDFANKEFADSLLKMTKKIAVGDPYDRSPTTGEWINTSSRIQLQPLKGIQIENVSDIKSITLKNLTVQIRQTSGRCNLHVRLFNGQTFVPVLNNTYYNPTEWRLDAYNKVTSGSASWANVSLYSPGMTLDQIQNAYIGIAYGEPAETTSTNIWVSSMTIEVTYAKSDVNVSMSGAPMPFFQTTKVSDLINAWKPEADNIGQIIKPHDKPSWVIPFRSRRMASVTAFALNPEN